MRIALTSLCTTTVVALSLSLVGCGSDSPQTPSEKIDGSPPPHTAEAGHDDHTGHDHDADAGHERSSAGPHGGHLIELGDEEYHLELLHDENTHTVTVYLLDGTGKHTVAVPVTEVTLQLFRDGKFVKYALKSVQGSEDTVGAASRFEIVDAALCDPLSHEDETRGRVHITIDGKSYTGTIEHDSHGDHDHEDHDHAGHDH